LLAALLGVVFCALVAFRTARAYNVYQDAWITLSARPLGMGGAFAAMSDAASVFYNPAGLARQRQLMLLFNHSARHFPGVEDKARHQHRADQLDADTEAFVVPLPFCTYAHGFTFSGEYGFDYRPLPADGSAGYPRENVWGNEDYHTLAFDWGLPVAAGISLRRQFMRLTPDPADTSTPPWLRLGQGTQWGYLAHLAPGLDYGHSELKLDYDWTLLAPSNKPGEGFAEMSSRLKTSRSGWALHPTAWLAFTQDAVRHDWRYPPDAGLGTLHRGEEHIDEIHTGGELQLGQLAKLRWGDDNGSATSGLAFNLGGLWLNYAEAKGLLPQLMGCGESFTDVHVYGAEARF
jgi:hypothetical protein